jgi:hypothetical protein
MSDLRVVYGLLANSALKEIDRPTNNTREVYLVNLVRLLEQRFRAPERKCDEVLGAQVTSRYRSWRKSVPAGHRS